MNVKPLSDRVLVLPNPAEEKTAGGLIIPDTAKEKPLAGKVVAVGPGTSEVKMEVKVGDQVLYGKYAGQEIQVDGVDYLIMKQNDILAVSYTHLNDFLPGLVARYGVADRGVLSQCRAVERVVAVSYTHLDVYKRQL